MLRTNKKDGGGQMKYVIGIDGGTQSTKVSVFTLDGKIVCEQKNALRPLY